MSDTARPETDSDPPKVYQVRIRGHLGSGWADWFEGMSITSEDNDDSLLTGPVVDQAALHGLLRGVRDLGIPLLSVIRVSFDGAVATGTEEITGSRSFERSSGFEATTRMDDRTAGLNGNRRDETK